MVLLLLPRQLLYLLDDFADGVLSFAVDAPANDSAYSATNEASYKDIISVKISYRSSLVNKP